MKFIVYIPEESKIVSCEVEDFFSEELCALDSIDELSGTRVLGACVCGEDFYSKCYLLQVVGDEFLNTALKFLRRIFFERTKSLEKRTSLATFNLLPKRSQKQPCIEMALSKDTILPCPILKTKQEPVDADVPPPLKRARLSLPLPTISPTQCPQENSEPSDARDNSSRKQRDLEATSAIPLPGKQSLAQNEKCNEHKCVTDGLLKKILDQLKVVSKKLDQLNSTTSLLHEPEFMKLDLPMFVEEEDLMKEVDVSQWMLQQGGANLKDFMTRCLGQLIAPELQTKINRTGKKSKLKFPPFLETQLKESVYRLFPNCTAVDTEHAIVRFLHNAADRINRSRGCDTDNRNRQRPLPRLQMAELSQNSPST